MIMKIAHHRRKPVLFKMRLSYTQMAKELGIREAVSQELLNSFSLSV